MYHYNNVIFYRYQPDADFSDEHLVAALNSYPFTPRSRHEHKRSGWAEPFPNLMIGRTQYFGGANVIDLQMEEAILPAAAVRKALEEKVTGIEKAEGRKVYRKERTVLKDEVVLDMLPRALSRDKHTRALLMPAAGLIAVEASTFTAAETLLSALRESLGSLKVRMPEVAQAPAAEMTSWLLETTPLPAGFALGQACELRDQFGEGGTIKVKGQPLISDEIRAHLANGMEVSRLALCWEDQYTFTLHEDLSIHSLKLTNEYRDQLEENSPEDELAAIGADVTHLVLEMRRLYSAIVKAFGGEQQMLTEAAA